MAHDVFISYSSRDKPTADAVCAALESRGVRCWIAPRDVPPGEEYAAALVKAVSASLLMVLVFSSGANQSPQVLREVERAVSKGLPILPLRIEDIPPTEAMEYYIASRHWLDALTPPLERHLSKLADSVEFLLQQEGDIAQNSNRTEPSAKTAAPLLTFQSVQEDPKRFLQHALGPYILKEFVGSGGSGLVYRGWNSRLSQAVCVKVLYPVQGDSRLIQPMISKGVRALAALNHPFVIRMFDWGECELADSKSFYLVMEFVEGTNLAAWSRNLQNNIATKERFQMALNLTTALGAAHGCTYIDESGFEQRGLLHGDIKPTNVIVRPNNQPVLLDFLLADVQRIIDPQAAREYPRENADTLTNAFGTPGFMSPEQEIAGLITVRSDIYSLGVTFCSLFLGDQQRPLFEVLRSRRDCLDALCALLAAMIARSPEERPLNTAAVAQSLVGAALEAGVLLPAVVP